MNIRLTALFLILSNFTFAQTDERSPTKFDKFINLSNVQWAAYVRDTIRFKYTLNDELYKRFQKGDIRISQPLSRDSLMSGNSISYLDKSELAQRSFAPGTFTPGQNLPRPTNRVDSNSSIINVEQIFYVSGGKLYSYIPWVTPKISVYTSRDKFIGTAEYFSSCINPKHNFKPSKRDDIIFMGTTSKKILPDSFPRADMLKQLYGINMLEAIWKETMNDRNEIIDLKSGQRTSMKNLQEYNITVPVTIPVYDSSGNILGTRNYNVPVSPSLFPQVEITQNWFYDRTKNIVFNSIPTITFFVRSKSQVNFGELYPFIKIIFK